MASSTAEALQNEAYLSEWASNGIKVAPGAELTYRGRKWMPALFDTDANKKLCKMSRQVGKSTFGSALSTSLMALNNRFNILYAAPEQDQTQKYSHDKVTPMIEGSPALSSIIGTPNNVFEKKFSNTQSKYYLKWAKHNPDACRGITVDMVHYDEVQDQSLDEIEPVINEAMFTADKQRLLYTGTPKSYANPIHGLWQKSDQREWIIQCTGCSRYNNLGISNIGKKGPICKHCGKLLDVDNGQWVKHRRDADIAGFHVHQLHCKISHAKWDREDGVWRRSQDKWDVILDKYENYRLDKFLNEVLGVSADTAELPMSESMLKKACSDFIMHRDPQAEVMGAPIYAGIDWGRGSAATVLSLGQFRDGRFQYIFMKKYDGDAAKPDYCIPDILQILREFRVSRAHCDHGLGWGMNGRLDTNYGGHRVTSCYYSNSASSADYTWKTKHKEVPCLTLNKSKACSAFIEAIRKQDVLFPTERQFFSGFSEDFMNVRTEVDRRDNLRYVKAEGGNDDTFHACLYAYVIAMHDAAGSEI